MICSKSVFELLKQCRIWYSFINEAIVLPRRFLSQLKRINGLALLQLETLGNKGRENVDKTSQVIQVDEETLKYLLSLFDNSNKVQY